MMDTTDPNTAQEKIVRTASLAACVLARADQLALIELTGKPDVVSQSTMLINAGFTYHGLVGIVDGKVETAANDPLDLESAFNMGRAARMFGCLVAAPVATGDGAEWLEKLHRLPDLREN
jgi:hypothetical protein